VNATNEHGETALHWAADPEDEEGGAEMIRFLVSRGANVDAVVPDGGSTPLMYALISCREQAATELIRQGADPSAKDEDGTVALDMCDDDVLRGKLERIVEATGRRRKRSTS